MNHDLITRDQPQESFEDHLRSAVKASPYVFISLVIHGILGLIFYLMPAQGIDLEPSLTIKGSVDEYVEPLPPEELDTPPEIEEIEEIIEEPVVTEDVVTEVQEVIDSVNIDSPFDSVALNDAIGIGGGGGGFGKLGRRIKGQKAGEASEQAVDLALRWLADHQSDYGSYGLWEGNAFDLQCDLSEGHDPCTGLSASAQHDVGLTSLALLAFLGAGNTDREGKYKDTVKKGLRFLIEGQDGDGCLAETSYQMYTYDHIIGTIALCEAYSLTKRHIFKKAANKALDYMYSIRNPSGAWRYAATHPEMSLEANDVSVTGWAIIAMTIAKEAGLSFDEDALIDSIIFIEEMTGEDGRTGYFERGGVSSRLKGLEEIWPQSNTEAMTAVGVLCRIFTDPEFTLPGNREMVDKGVGIIMETPLEWDLDNSTVDFYYWYYATYALYQYSALEEGRRPWKEWEKRMVDTILSYQLKSGHEKGSWHPDADPWGSVGGRVYSTALMALCLEVFYRYDTVLTR